MAEFAANKEKYMPVQVQSDFRELEPQRHDALGTPGAVVIGGDYQGLGIVRSLGRRGIPVCVIDDELSIARFSRYATSGFHVSDLRNTDRTIETLMDLGQRLHLAGWVLFPTRDEIVAALSRQRSTLSQCFRVPTQGWETIRWVWDKRNTYQLAKELSIPIPETWFPQTPEDLDRITTPFPLVLKPAIKEHFFYATKDKAWRVNSRTELRELFLRASALAGPGEVLVQDLIPGGGTQQFAYCAFVKDGNAVGSMVVRRRRQHPHDFGRASTFVETVDMPQLETLSERFLQAINYYGLIEIEYKLDPRDGQYKLLDVNARTWGYHTLGPCAGVDFPYLLYADQMGEDVRPCRGQPGISWVRLLTDIPAGIIDVWRGRLRCQDFLKSLRDFHTEAVFSREDPLPGIMECALLPYLIIKRGF
ncbi:MAG: carboxylate--amine ligase [Candidatus Acidiferrales bacterium]